MKAPDVYVGKRLFVGGDTAQPACIGIGQAEIRGSAYVEGPASIGVPLKFGLAEAGIMISNVVNTDVLVPCPSIIKIRSSLVPTPIDVVIGDPVGPVGVNVFCGPAPFVVQSASISLITLLKQETAQIAADVYSVKDDIGAKFNTGAKMETGVDTNVALAFNSAPIIGQAPSQFPDFVSGATTLNTTYGIAISKKPFDILHPTKDGHRLRYVSLEGPAAEVYVRGKIKGTNYIELPDYWRGLVDIDSITVNLTPIGVHQELYYDDQVDSSFRIKVMNSAGGPINCSYTVFAERKDTEKNIPEYKGLTVDDYPGDNSDYRLG